MRTSLKHFSTIPGTLLYVSSPVSSPDIAELDADLWEFMRWPGRKPTLEQIHWIAGVFEGEGSFSSAQIYIHQKDREILDQVRYLVGGRVIRCWSENAISGGIWMHRWYESGSRARGIARTLFHLLSTRRRAQARQFLRISRLQEPPQLDPIDPSRLLWDWAPDEDLEAQE